MDNRLIDRQSTSMAALTRIVLNDLAVGNTPALGRNVAHRIYGCRAVAALSINAATSTGLEASEA